MSAVNVTLEPNIEPQSDPPLQRSQFRRITASAVRGSENVQLWRMGSRLRAFQRAVDEVRTLPLIPPKGGS